MLFVACCSNIGNHFIIEGQISGAEEGEMVCLSYPIKRDGIWKWQCDTTYIHAEHFRFSGCIDDLRTASLTFQNMDYANIYIEPTNIKFKAHRNSLYDYSLQGLSIDKELTEYRTIFGDLERELWEKLHLLQRKNMEWIAASENKTTNYEQLLTEFYALVAEHRALNSRWAQLATEFTEKHTDYAITPAILEQLVAQGCNISPNKEYKGTMGELLTLRRKITEACGAAVGSKALDFTLKTADGKEVRLCECYANSCVLLDFWASWCSPCIAELPKLKTIYDKYKDKLQVLSISVDEDKEQWREALKQFNLTEWPQLIIDRVIDADSYYFREQSDLSIAYGVMEIPCFILINREGVVIGRWNHLTENVEKEISENL